MVEMYSTRDRVEQEVGVRAGLHHLAVHFQRQAQARADVCRTWARSAMVFIGSPRFLHIVDTWSPSSWSVTAYRHRLNRISPRQAVCRSARPVVPAAALCAYMPSAACV